MTFELDNHPLSAAYTAILNQGLDGAGEALRILVNEACKIERNYHLNAQPFERTEQRQGYANGFKPKTVLTRMGELTFSVPQVRDSTQSSHRTVAKRIAQTGILGRRELG